jgi:predicted MFS family arabinose efflux permease
MLIPAAMFTMFFFLTLVLQNVMGESPMQTGLMFLPFSIAMIMAAGFVSRLVQKVNPGRLAATGALIASVAVFGFSRLPYDDSVGHLAVDINYWTHIFPFILIMPIGMALVFIPMTMSVVHGVSPADSGIASGVLNTMQQVGGALGLATLSTIAFNAATSKATEICAKGCDAPQALVQGVSFTHGATIGFLACSIMLFLGGVVALLFNRIKHEDLAGREQEPVVAAH